MHKTGNTSGCNTTFRHHESKVCGRNFCIRSLNVDMVRQKWMRQKSGCDRRNARRKYGYSIRGMRPVEPRLLIRGVRYSAIPIMSTSGLHDIFLAMGTINGDRFRYFVRNFLHPILRPYNTINPLPVVIMDNASIHHVQSTIDLIESAGSRVVFLPPYSPDLNPLEPVSRKNGDPIKMGTPVPIITARNGDPLIEMGTPYHTRGWCKFELRLSHC